MTTPESDSQEPPAGVPSGDPVDPVFEKLLEAELNRRIEKPPSPRHPSADLLGHLQSVSLGHSHQPPATMIENVDDLHLAIEDGRSMLSIASIRGFAGHAREKYDEVLGESKAGLPIQRLANKMRGLYKLAGKKAERYGAQLLNERSVLDFIGYAHQKKMTVNYFAQAFLQAAAVRERMINRSTKTGELLNGTHEVCSLALPGNTIEYHGGQVGANHVALYQNAARNWLRLIGVMPEVEYDELHRDGYYLFMNNAIPTDFARRNVMQCMDGLVQGKDILELGPGAGADATLFLKNGAKSVEVVDSSYFVLEHLRASMQAKGENVGRNLIVPGEAQDMYDAVADLASQGCQYDTVYSHSSIHFLDDTRLRRLLELLTHCLREGGHFAFSVKAPGATLDGKGIPLINEVEETSDETVYGVHDRASLGFDGQIRHYRSYLEWEKILNEQLKVLDASRSWVADYATPGKRQLFYNFICALKPQVILAPDVVAKGDTENVAGSGEEQQAPLSSPPFPYSSGVPGSLEMQTPTIK